MPFRPEIRHFYGARWRRMRRIALGDRGLMPGNLACDHCGRPHPRLNWAHLAGDPRIAGPMGWLCPRCHSRHDTPFRVAATRRTRARRCGQLWLLPELEYANLPLALWPALAIREMEHRAQLNLHFPAAA